MSSGASSSLSTREQHSSSAATMQRRKRSQRSVGPKSSNPVVAAVWRFYIWLAGTFSLGMLDVWEQLLVCFVVMSLSSLIWWSVYFHFPNHLRSVVERGTYYIFGTSNASVTSNSGKAAFYAHSEL